MNIDSIARAAAEAICAEWSDVHDGPDYMAVVIARHFRPLAEQNRRMLAVCRALLRCKLIATPESPLAQVCDMCRVVIAECEKEKQT